MNEDKIFIINHNRISMKTAQVRISSHLKNNIFLIRLKIKEGIRHPNIFPLIRISQEKEKLRYINNH